MGLQLLSAEATHSPRFQLHAPLLCHFQAVSTLPPCKEKIPFKLLTFHQTTYLCYLCHLLASLWFPTCIPVSVFSPPLPSLILGDLRTHEMMNYPATPPVLGACHLSFSDFYHHFICPSLIPCHSFDMCLLSAYSVFSTLQIEYCTKRCCYQKALVFEVGNKHEKVPSN